MYMYMNARLHRRRSSTCTHEYTTRLALALVFVIYTTGIVLFCCKDLCVVPKEGHRNENNLLLPASGWMDLYCQREESVRIAGQAQRQLILQCQSPLNSCIPLVQSTRGVARLFPRCPEPPQLRKWVGPDMYACAYARVVNTREV